jgi:hypothetical protein
MDSDSDGHDGLSSSSSSSSSDSERENEGATNNEAARTTFIDVRELCTLVGVPPPPKRKHKTDCQRVDSINSSANDVRMVAPKKARKSISHEVPTGLISRCCTNKCFTRVSASRVRKLRRRAKACCVSRLDKNAFFGTITFTEKVKPKGPLICRVNGTPVCRAFALAAVGGSTKIIDNVRKERGGRQVCTLQGTLWAAVTDDIRGMHDCASRTT